MDSRMLNVFHEDPFEGNFVKYDPEPNFWSTNDDLQLTDTLNGILPIDPTDESLLSQSETEVQLQNSKNLLIYSDFMDHQLSDDAHVLNDQQRKLSALIDLDEEEDEAVAVIRLKGDDDVHSQCSNSTFRTRTDSSSIGDYESHSSDYDDEIEGVNDECLLSTDEFAMQEERKNRTLSTNTIGSDADAFGLNIDVNNFDLAEFITKDDFTTNAAVAAIPIKFQTAIVKLKTQPTIAAKRPVAPLPKAEIISSKSRDSDYDSDSIIDVETVDVDESRWVARQAVENSAAADDLCYVDNVKDDPSWCPKQQAKRLVAAETPTPTNPMASKVTVALAVPSQASTAKPKATNNICLVPNKKQCDFLKRKVGAKMVGNHSMPIKSKVSAKKIHEATKSTTPKQQTKPAELPATRPAGLGLGGKNLALLKQERDASTDAVHPVAATIAPKRKLNLEEYKQRRCGTILPVRPTTITPASVPSKQAKVETSKVLGTAPGQKAHPSPQKAAISSIVNSLKSPVVQAAVPTDPITAAKNKVLRMLEIKRAQQLKIIDSRVTAKVPRVTKLPPLKDIVKDTYYMIESESQPETAPTQVAGNSKLLADYEEIIIVSTSCNTDITIPPLQASVALRDNRTTTPSSRSLLKSSVLLYNISNGNEAGKDMTNSLIASIQCEVVKQTNCVALATTATTAATASTGVKSSDKNTQHGEDMVIMHLAKNRVRKRMVSMGTQTELQPEFPLLTLPTTRQSRERTRRVYRKRLHEGNASNDSSCSSSSACSSIASYRSRSNSNSMERLRHSDATAACGSSIGGGGYSSRSTRRHRSSVSSSSYSEAGKYERQQRQRRTSYNKRRFKNRAHDTCSTSGSEYSDRERSRSPQRRSRSRSTSATRFGNNNKCNNNSNNNNRRGFVDRNVSQPAVEERRIVYVGRIEPDTNKEQLRRKFLPYGSIKQITIHYKENGMKYGFVTFERAQDAFTAIDTSARDAQINMYDISFGGRRAFCRASYADLDNAGINNYHSYVFPKAAPAQAPQEDSFEALLLKVKAKLNAGKPAASVQTTPADQEAVTPTPTAVANLDGDNKNQNMNNSQI
ncbi:GH18535 [Drosophila grimshawi]|uniref:GH18535 n=1 Tax=Drosophila grimshawi TaxID=7222 RepID=B4JI90_DROGR|nr:GH18535 [Drosophila grimshawi]